MAKDQTARQAFFQDPEVFACQNVILPQAPAAPAGTLGGIYWCAFELLDGFQSTNMLGCGGVATCRRPAGL